MATEFLKFKNFSNEDFAHTFDSIPLTFKAGQEIYLEDFKAYHFAKHLVDREMNKLGIPTDRAQIRKELGGRCFPKDEVRVTPIEAIQIEEGKKEKKVVKKVIKEEFES